MVFTCAACRFRARSDGTCNNKDCARYSAPRTGEHWKLKRLRREELGEVAREDGTCNNKDCAGYSAPRSGEHWKLERLRRELGEVADRFGDFVHGACVASLSHRHDVRMGIASGMLLRGRIASAAVRLEVLCVAYLCYWKWRAAGFLQRLLHREDEFLRADAQGRACLYERAWEEAVAALPVADFAVVCRRGHGTAELWPRERVQALTRAARHHYYCYTLGGRPGDKNRLEDFQLAVLIQDLRSGTLESALANIAAALAASGATYSACDAHLRSVRPWNSRKRALRINFLCWLFKAEGVTAKICKEDWALLAGSKARGLKPSLAVAACAVVRRHVWPAPGAPSYGLDDLACFLSLSQSREAVGSRILPPPAAPVAVAVDLGDVGSSCAQVPRKGLRLKSAADAGESRQPPAAGSSCAGSGAASSGACPPARPARRRTGLLRAQVRVTPWVQVLTRGDTHILQIIMDELPLRDQVALCRASKNQRAKCIWTARRWGIARWSEVRILMSRTLRQDQPIWEEYSATASGVALGSFLGSLCRAESCAWDITELLKTGPLPADTELLALGLARRGLKLEFVEAGLRVLSRDLGAGGRLHMPGVDAVEEWIEEAARRQRDRPVPLPGAAASSGFGAWLAGAAKNSLQDSHQNAGADRSRNDGERRSRRRQACRAEGGSAWEQSSMDCDAARGSAAVACKMSTPRGPQSDGDFAE